MNRTISGLEVLRIDAERQLLLVKGSVPGANGGDVVVRPAAKFYKPKVKQAPKQAAKAEAKPAKPEAKPAAKPEAKPAAKPAPAKS